MTSHWTRRALLQAGAAGAARLLAAEPPRVKLPRPVRVGIIGLDGHFGEVTDAAKVTPEIQVVAVATAKESDRPRLASNPALAGVKVYDDYRRLLDAEKLDAVCVCNENADHAATTIACAERRLAVACEKPLAISLDELDAVKKAVARHGTRLTMLLPMRFEPPYLAMRALVEAGEIGEPVALGAQKSYKLGSRPDWMRRRASYGGTIPFIGAHMIDLMRWTSGRDFVETAAFQSTTGFPALGDMENNTAIIFRLDNRGTADLRMDFLRPETAPTHGDDLLRLAGTKGVAEFREGEGLTLITASQKPHRVTDLPQHAPLFADFLDSIYNGRKHHLPLEDVYRVSEILLRAREAAETGRVVKV